MESNDGEIKTGRVESAPVSLQAGPACNAATENLTGNM